MSLHVQIPCGGCWATALCTSSRISAYGFGGRLAATGTPVRVITAGGLHLEALTGNRQPVPDKVGMVPLVDAVKSAMKTARSPSDDMCLCVKGDGGEWVPVCG